MHISRINRYFTNKFSLNLYLFFFLFLQIKASSINLFISTGLAKENNWKLVNTTLGIGQKLLTYRFTDDFILSMNADLSLLRRDKKIDLNKENITHFKYKDYGTLGQIYLYSEIEWRVFSILKIYSNAGAIYPVSEFFEKDYHPKPRLKLFTGIGTSFLNMLTVKLGCEHYFLGHNYFYSEFPFTAKIYLQFPSLL